jgi:hypothetical protein
MHTGIAPRPAAAIPHTSFPSVANFLQGLDEKYTGEDACDFAQYSYTIRQTLGFNRINTFFDYIRSQAQSTSKNPADVLKALLEDNCPITNGAAQILFEDLEREVTAIRGGLA